MFYFYGPRRDMKWADKKRNASSHRHLWLKIKINLTRTSTELERILNFTFRKDLTLKIHLKYFDPKFKKENPKKSLKNFDSKYSDLIFKIF